VEDQHSPIVDAATVDTPSQSTRRQLPRLLLNLVTVAVTVFFSYIALSDINLSLAWRALRTSDYWWLIIALIASGVLAVYGDRPLRLLLRPLRRFSLFSGERLERTLEELTDGLSGLRHGRLALETAAWTVGAWLLTGLCAYLVTVAFHLHLPFA
jgi:uncharacterized membrane protein YbhN (UPF0104 family)